VKYLIGWTAFLLGLWAFIAAIIAFVHTEWIDGLLMVVLWFVLMGVAAPLVGRTSAGRAIFGRPPGE
jgi:hypothetical protein